jgi:hypothetical protein
VDWVWLGGWDGCGALMIYQITLRVWLLAAAVGENCSWGVWGGGQACGV